MLNTRLIKALAVIFLMLLAETGMSFGQGGSAQPKTESTGNKADQNLKSAARINPSTLAMELSIPFANYPGRNGNSLPVGLSYSSKLWGMKNLGTYFYYTPIGNYKQYVTQLRPVFAERSVAGWTSSVAFPTIEEKLDIFDQKGNAFSFDLDIDLFNYHAQSPSNSSTDLVYNPNLPCGFVCVERTRWCYDGVCTEWQCTGWDYNTANCGSGGWGGSACVYSNGYCPAECSYCVEHTNCPTWNPNCGQVDPPDPTTPQEPRKMHYVKKVHVRMGDGSTHEFRKSDGYYGYCNGGDADGPNCESPEPGYMDKTGMFLAVDGSGMKLERSSSGSVLYLPNGSRYFFPAQATGVFDKSTLYQADKFIDVDGNISSFEATTEQNEFARGDQRRQKLTDTLGREIYDPLPLNLESQEQQEGDQELSFPGVNGQAPQTYELKWLHLKPVPCDPPDLTTNCGSTEGALENQNENLYYYTNQTCFGSAENPIDPNTNEKLFPSNGLGIRLCNPHTGSTPQTAVAYRFNPVVLAKITLPNNKTYEFKYNQYGEITKIIYPTGTYETFKYRGITPMNGYDKPAYDQANRGVEERKIYNSSGVLQQTWKYSAEYIVNNANYADSTYKITTKSSTGDDASAEVIRAERYLHVDNRNKDDFGFDDPRAGMPKEERVYDENGMVRSRTLTEWVTKGAVPTNDSLRPAYSGAKRDARVKRTVSLTIEGNQALAVLSENEFDENDPVGSTDLEYFSHLNVKKTKAYQYASINPNLAKTGTFAQIVAQITNTPLASITETDYQYDASYKARGIPSLPKETRIMDPTDPTDPLVTTQTNYDEYDYTGSDSLGGALIPGVTGDLAATWSDPGSNPRGKPTTVKLWDSDNNDWIETHTQYDQYGNVRKVWEPNEPTTSDRFVEMQYSLTYGAAYPTKVITPPPDPFDVHGTDESSSATTTYDPMTGLPMTSTNEFGQTIANEYNDLLLRPTRSYGVNFAAPETQTIYDDSLLTVKVRKQIDQNNWDEATTYADSLGRTVMTQAKDSQGDVFVKTEYDLLGRVKRVSNPSRAGETLLWSETRYDELGRAVENYAPAASGQGASLGTTTYGISTDSGIAGTFVLTTDAAGRKKRAVTNSLGQLARVDEPDSSGIVKPLVQVTPNPTPNPSPTPVPTFTPDPTGCYNRVQNSQTQCPDSSGANSVYPSVSTIYKYDVKGNLTEAAQGNQKRYFKYDSLGRLIRVRQPEQQANDALDLADQFNTSGKWTAAFVYDALGNLLRATDANGVNIINEYDKAKRVTKRCYTKPNFTTSAVVCSQISSGDLSTNTPAVEYFYDGKGLDQIQTPHNFAKGKLTRVKTNVSDTRYKLFDHLGRLTESEQRTPVSGEAMNDALWRVSKYKYNLSGALIEQEYPSGRVVKNELEADGDLARIYGKANQNAQERTYANSFSYTPDGRIEKLKLGNGLWEAAKYNNRLQVTELSLGFGPADGSLWKLAYEYGELDASGTVLTAKNTGNIARQTLSFNGLAQPLVQSFRYDSLYRLAEARETSGAGTSAPQTWKQTFGYDRFGNRLGFNQTLGTEESGTHLAINSVTHPEINAATNRFNDGQNYGYDPNGNLTTDPQGRSFTFNGENKQTLVTNGSVKVGEYFYDGEGKRVRKKVYNPDGITVKEETVFVYDGLGKLVAEYSTVQPPPNQTTSYTATDLLGSPRVITNSLGEVVSRRDFMPFGEELFPDGINRKTENKYNYGDSIRQRFTGYQKDEETQLDFAEARMYEKRHARFTAVDPLLASGKSANPQTFNRYVYTSNNPIIRVDRNGLDWYEFWEDRVEYNRTYRVRVFSWADHPWSRPKGSSRVQSYIRYFNSPRGSYQGWGVLNPHEDAWTTASSREEAREKLSAYNRQAAINFIVGALEAASITFDLSGLGDNTGVQRGSSMYRMGFNSTTAATIVAAVSGVGATNFLVNRFGNVAKNVLKGIKLCCFVAGTPISTDKGLVPIEKIKVGDKVLSFNEKTKQLEYKLVAHTFVGVKENIVKIKIAGEKLLTTTTEHPFYVKKTHKARDGLSNDNDDEEGEWKTAAELKISQKVLRPDGKWTHITSIERSSEPTLVYNFEVEGNHNYFVGDIGVLSHNCNWTGKAIFGLDNPTAKGFSRYIDVVGGAFDGAKFMEFARKATEIRFDLSNFDPDLWKEFLRAGDFNPNSAVIDGSTTMWELRQILINPDLFRKTQFVNVPNELDLRPLR